MNGHAKPARRVATAVGIALVAGLLTASVRAQPATGPATQPATQPAVNPLDARAAELARKVLADPLDSSARMNLRQLRGEQARRLKEAYAALAGGLEAYLDVGAPVSAAALATAAQSSRASSLMADSPRPLPEILAEARQAVFSAAATAGQACRQCGGTREVPCRAPRCYGSGKVPCPQCKGSGVIRARNPLFKTAQAYLCGKCRGVGVVGCSSCGSTGTQVCRACKGKKPAAGARSLDEKTRRALRRAIAKARLLAGGRIDLYTNGARKPSPR